MPPGEGSGAASEHNPHPPAEKSCRESARSFESSAVGTAFYISCGGDAVAPKGAVECCRSTEVISVNAEGPGPSGGCRAGEGLMGLDCPAPPAASAHLAKGLPCMGCG